MKNRKLSWHVFAGLLLIMNFLPNYLCGICERCVCIQSEDSRLINCQRKRENENYTEIFDLLAFDESKMVKKLVITKHEIVTLPLDAFRGLGRLETLDLSDNFIDKFEADIFKDLKNLEELNFSFNRLETLSGAVFNYIQSLLVLNLSYNRIGDFNDTTAYQLPKLTSFDVSHNNLSTIDSEFVKSLGKLEFFDVSYNRITFISADALLQLKSLSELRISDNLLKIITGQDFPDSLVTLDVSGNMINSFPRDISHIRYLNIADNTISAIDINASGLKKLQYLNISGNSLTSFPKIILEVMKTLDLSRNDFSIIPKTLSYENLPLLETLMIDGNPIKDLRFNEELHLRRLYVRRVKRLEAIEIDAFVKLRGINEECINLTISKNPRLSRIEEGALNGIKICTLDLSKNAFTRISPKVIKSNDKFVAERGIDLQGNPFRCDCQLQWMLNDLVPHLYKLNPGLLEDLRCHTPLVLSGARMVHWFTWKEQVFCDKSARLSSRMSLDKPYAMADSETTIRLESSREMLAIVAGSMGILCILIILGIIVARKVETRKRRTNRRF